MAAIKCTLAIKHKWEWVKDVTNTSISISSNGKKVRMSRRGVYKCSCGASREGIARSGL